MVELALHNIQDSLVRWKATDCSFLFLQTLVAVGQQTIVKPMPKPLIKGLSICLSIQLSGQ